MGTEASRRWRATHREYLKAQAKAYYFKNKEKMNTKRKQWVADNYEHWRAYQRAWGEANPDKIRVYHKKWAINHPAQYKAIARKSQAKARENLGCNYIKSKICQGTELKHFDIPQDLVKLWRLQLLAKRKLKKL